MFQLNHVYTHHILGLAISSVTALTLNLLTTTIVVPPSNASKWQMGFNSAFKGLMLSKERGETGV